jgi:hypothetical protein
LLRLSREDTIIPLVTFNNNIVAMRGKSGKSNFAKTEYGTEYKANPIRKTPQTAAQIAQQNRLKKAAAAFHTLTAAQNTAWQNYANTVFITQKGGAKVHPSAYSAYSGLYTKFIQIAPNGTPPVLPPSAEFEGDTVNVTASAVDGVITFTANKANATSVTTELLIQPLANMFRKPRPTYVSKGFFTFVTGTLTKTLTVPPGAYSVAIRFVNSATGQQVDHVVLGTVNAD